MVSGTKLRILYLYQHLIKETDAEHPLSTAELMKILDKEYNLKVSRNTICDDLAVLHESNLNIEYYKSTQNKYYYDGQTYDLAELKVLVDAISSSKFITQRKSEELIAKLLTLTSNDNAAKLRRHIYVTGRVKGDNEGGYYIVDAINGAIDLKRKIRFHYMDYDVNKKKYVTNNGESYTVSPYTLIWDGDYYYMRGFCDERKAMRNFRIDRIEKSPILLNEIAVMAPDDYSPAEYSKSVFRMFDTDKPEKVQLLCDKNIMKYIVDNFGKEIDTIPLNEEQFKAVVTVCASSTFYRWIFGFGGRVKIISPEKCKKEYKSLLEKALKEV